MAIVLQFNVIIARKAEIGAKYPGGMAQFRIDWLIKPPERWCEDEYLLAFSSMGNYFRDVYESLRSFDIDVFATSEVQPPEENASRCGWLDWNVYRTEERGLPPRVMKIDVVQYWLRGHEPGDVVPFARRKHCS
jgi:hypothetical protein